ncbi:hypothetical protein C7974DRAFT_443778 [Boeremia exigua]|uniref:uncharacterized protein n=1 Tax=Boeremia exigua TaxID=749465 RepID=UPI001E8DE7DE|nr:uncharacterized protein C7974DRAFT_443778 [Boeremia exigua]KAH6613907.1 hypothetical protein C7974DRAFT_443778 [Boeremia exigua]
MCRYRKKLHTCTHLSDRPYIELCRPGFTTNTVCASISTSEPRRSHFPCWQCIKTMARAEALEALEAAERRVAAADQAARLKVEMEKRERVRREARERAEHERAVEGERRGEREREVERVRREGAAWVVAEAGRGGRKKGRGGAVGSPGAAFGVVKKEVEVAREGAKEGVKTGLKENGKVGWKEEKSEVGGRAGVWGPKKILSRKEGAAGVLGIRADAVDKNGKK